MKIKKSELHKIIKEEVQKVLDEQMNFNTKLLNKVMTRDRLGRYKQCRPKTAEAEGYVVLRKYCMGRQVAKIQAMINQWFEENHPGDKAAKKMLKVDGLFGTETAEAIGYIYNTVYDPNGPNARNVYDVSIDRVLAKGNNIAKAVAAVQQHTSPASMVARAMKPVDRTLGPELKSMLASPVKDD